MTQQEKASASPPQLSAGIELDALIAEKVMGATGRQIVYEWADRKKRERPLVAFDLDSTRDVLRWDFGTFCSQGGEKIPRGLGFPDRYSTDIAAAWLVVEKMRAGGWAFQCDDNVGAGPWYASFRRGMLGRDQQGEAATPALAICLAALEAVSRSDSDATRPASAPAVGGSL